MRYTLTRDAAICIVRWCCQHWCTSLRCLRPRRSAQKQRGSSHRRSNRCLRRAHRTRFNNSYYPCRSVFQHPMTTCYECPRWDPYDRPTFDDLPLTIWWCVVTMTGVGYGAALLHTVATTYEDNDNLLYRAPHRSTQRGPGWSAMLYTGDMYPTSAKGQVVAALTAAMGVFVRRPSAHSSPPGLQIDVTHSNIA